MRTPPSLRFTSLPSLIRILASKHTKPVSIKINLKAHSTYEQLDTIVKSIQTCGYDTYLLQSQGWFRLTDNPFPLHTVVPSAQTTQLLCVPEKESLCYVEFLHNSALNGGERAALKLNQELTSKGALATIVLPQPGPLEVHFRNLSIPTRIVPFSWWAGPKKMNKKIQEELIGSTINTLDSLQVIAKMNPHFISSQTSVIPWGLLSAVLLSKPHAIHIHEFGVLDHGLKYYFGWKWMMRLALHLSTFVSFNSKAVKSVYAPLMGKKKSAVFYTPANIPARVATAPVPRVFTKKSFKLIIMGNISPSKGQLLVARAVTELIEEGHAIELFILGLSNDSAYMTEIMDYISAHPTTHIKIHGFVKNPFPYLHQADALIVASRQEAYGLVVVESFMLKKTVIAADSGGLPELIEHKSNGLLFASGDIADLKKQILFCIKNPKKCARMEEKAHQSVQQFQKRYAEDVSGYARFMKSQIPKSTSHMPHQMDVTKIIVVILKLGLKIFEKISPLAILIAGAIYTQAKLIALLVVTFRKTRPLFSPASIGSDSIIGWAQYQGYPMYYETLLFLVFICIPLATLMAVKLIVRKGRYDI